MADCQVRLCNKAKGLKTVFVESERREKNITLLSPDPTANAYHVTDEFVFSTGTPPNIRPDVVLFINGIPVIVVETKAATHIEGIAEAFDQIRRYHRQGPEMMALTQLHALTHLLQFYYGATWDMRRQGLFSWRDDAAQSGDFETLVKSFIAPQRVVRLLSDFILFLHQDDALIKAVLRPHQMRAVERCLVRAADPDKRRGLIWHTQGSGKTFTMITTAKRLIDDSRFENPTVLMLIDRNELETQLIGNLESVGFQNVAIAESKDHLRELLASDQRGLIVSMIHKFDKASANLSDRSNIYILVDEAHRTTGGDLGNYLMGALPNATYIGFTGTPIDKTEHGKGTFKVFGTDDKKGYLDKYSIRESVEDGTTVPLHYALAPNDLRVDRETLEKEFFSLAELEGVDDIEELNRVLEEAVTLKNMLKNHDRIEQIAEYVATHFREHIEPMGYKAFLVGVDREACALYKQALDKHLPAEYSQVVISSGHNDTEELERHHISKDKEKAVRKAFRKPDGQPQILIVTEKLLTGYDAPILYCMYLDKPMRDHVLLQAIARVNRPYEDETGRHKPAGFVLDFVGIFDNLERALAFDSHDVSGVVEGINILQQRFTKQIAEGKSKYLTIGQSLKGDKQVEAILEHFRDQEERAEFYSFFHDLQDLYEILSPDAFLRPHVDDYNELARMHKLLRANYDRGISVDRSFLRKTAKLVQEQTESGEITDPDRIRQLDAETLQKIAAAKKPDTVKVFNLLKAIHAYVQRKSDNEPYLHNIGERADTIIKQFEQRQHTTKETLQSLDQLVEEIVAAEAEREETNLSPEGFAVYWYLKQEGINDAQSLAQQVESSFSEHPHWQSSRRQEQEVRKSLYKTLIEAKIDGVVDMAKNVMRMLRKSR